MQRKFRCHAAPGVGVTGLRQSADDSPVVMFARVGECGGALDALLAQCAIETGDLAADFAVVGPSSVASRPQLVLSWKQLACGSHAQEPELADRHTRTKFYESMRMRIGAGLSGRLAENIL